MIERLGVLTGGGDSPGINAAIRAIVRKAHEEGLETVGFLEGWLGLVENRRQQLGLKDVSGILPLGGAILGSSRTNPFRMENGPERVAETYKKSELDALIAIGGDDTLGVAHRLKDYGLKMVGIPQTIDNDLRGTEYSIGFDSAITTVTEALDKLHTTAFSHHRIMILEVMGRDAGWVGLLGGLAGGADVILIPEREFRVTDVQERIKKRQRIGKHFSIVVVAEGAKPAELGKQVVASAGKDAFGHPKLGGISSFLADQLSQAFNLPVQTVVLSYLQRGGSSSPFDRILATRFGVKAVEFALEGKFDVMTALRGGEVILVPLEEALGGPKPAPKELIELAELFY